MPGRPGGRGGDAGDRGACDDGLREVLGLDVRSSEDGAFCLDFLRSLVARGLSGVRLVISDEGIKGTIGAMPARAGWQRCRVHVLRGSPEAKSA